MSELLVVARRVVMLGVAALVVLPSLGSAAQPPGPERALGSLGAEVAQSRTASSRTYRQADGRMRTRVFPEAVNFRGERGWQKIDNTLVAAGGRVLCIGAPMTATR